MAAMSSDTLPEAYYLFAGALFTSAGWVDTVLYALTRRTLLFNELSAQNHPRPTKATRSMAPPRQGSTESILAQAGFGSGGGIVMDRTVKVELDDLESHDGIQHEGKSYFVSAKAMRN